MQTQRAHLIPRIAIVGAGLAGLACASRLRAAGLQPTLFDKSRGPAGRMSTRRGEGWQCDHGAQYFTARDPQFRAEVDRWQQAGVAAAWSPRLHIIGPEAGHRPEAGLERFVGLPGMTAPARWLAQGLDLRLEQAVQGLCRTQQGWQLQLDGASAGPFDAVLLALPAPQAAALLDAATTAPALLQAAATPMRACWALMLGYAQPLGLEFDAAFVNAGPLRWLARDSSKPGRPAGETWLLHANAAWSEAHLEAAPEQVSALLLQAFVALGGDPQPSRQTAHRWRYADQAQALQSGCVWQAGERLGLAGDWLSGGKVEGAWISGRRLAEALLDGWEPAA